MENGIQANIMNALACRSRRADRLIYNARAVGRGRTYRITQSSESKAAEVSDLTGDRETSAVPRVVPDDHHSWLHVYTTAVPHSSNTRVSCFVCAAHSDCNATLCVAETLVNPTPPDPIATTTATGAGIGEGGRRVVRRRRRRNSFPSASKISKAISNSEH